MANNLARLRQWSKQVARAVMGRSTMELTIEHSRTLIIRKRHLVRVWCSDCGCEVDGIALAELTAFLGEGDLAVLGQEGRIGNWHFIEGAGTEALVCLEFLRRLP